MTSSLSHKTSLADPASSRRNGAALIVVLGVLTILTLLIVAFAITNQVNRLATRNFREQAAAEHYIRAGIPLAMASIANSMDNATVPSLAWDQQRFLILSNHTDSAACRPLINALTNALPLGWRSIVATSPEDFETGWAYVIQQTPSGEIISTNGRIAFIAADLSDFIDVNTASAPLLRALCGVDFESPEEREPIFSIADLTAGDSVWVNVTSNLVCDSLDVAPDTYLPSNAIAGLRLTQPLPRFAINGLTNYAQSESIDTYQQADFVSQYLEPLSWRLLDAGFTLETANTLRWNLINALDEDTLPQDDTPTPWLSPNLVESVPIINEFAFLPIPPLPADQSNHYEFVVELWHPFLLEDLNPADYKLSLSVQRVITNLTTGGIELNARSDLLLPLADITIEENAGAFLLLHSGDMEHISFPVENGAPGTPHTAYLPIGQHTFIRPVGGVPTAQTVVSIALISASLSNTVYGATVDLAPAGGELWPFTDTTAIAATAPLDNANPVSWAGPIALESATLGTTNGFAFPNTGYNPPLPTPNGPFESIGAVGLVCTSNFATVDCLTPQGAALFDLLTVRNATNHPIRGLVGVAAESPVWQALFSTVGSGPTNSPGETLSVEDSRRLATALADSLVVPTPLTRPTWSTLLPRLTSHPEWEAWANGRAEDEAEGPLRHIVESVTFRQNIIALYLLAQATNDDGTLPVAERRAVAIVLRDAYTGRWELANLQWVND